MVRRFEVPNLTRPLRQILAPRELGSVTRCGMTEPPGNWDRDGDPREYG
jgi:hypothetical protein